MSSDDEYMINGHGEHRKIKNVLDECKHGSRFAGLRGSNGKNRYKGCIKKLMCDLFAKFLLVRENLRREFNGLIRIDGTSHHVVFIDTKVKIINLGSIFCLNEESLEKIKSWKNREGKFC
jgi:hypothetical protein